MILWVLLRLKKKSTVDFILKKIITNYIFPNSTQSFTNDFKFMNVMNFFESNNFLSFHSVINLIYMVFHNALTTFIRKLDLFATSQLIRFKEEGQYGTLTGGITTILLLIIFFTALIQSVRGLYDSSNITLNTSTTFEADPSSA